MFRSKLLVIAVTLALLVTAFLGTGRADAAAGRLTVSLSADKSAFGAGDSALVNVTVRNDSKIPAKVLKWFTPYEDVEDSLFVISRDGATVKYLGATYKRTAPTAADYVTLAPGESFTRTVDLGGYYDLSASGRYSVQFRVSSWFLRSEKGTLVKRDTTLSSNVLVLNIEGRSNPIAPFIQPDAVSGQTSFNRCNSSQQSDLVSARSNASTYAANAYSYLNAGTQGPRYTTWFGIFDASRYSTVKAHYSAIGGAMDTATITFDCSCKKKTVYAYVYANQPYTIYLCNVFWIAPMTGTDSKAGTLIHEMSHFTVVAGTDDWVYGQAGAMNLASTNPTNAVDNADNHEYFAENNPYQQ